MANYPYQAATSQNLSGPLSGRPTASTVPPGSFYTTTDGNGIYQADAVLGWIYTEPTLVASLPLTGGTLTGDLSFAEGATATVGTSDNNAFQLKSNGIRRYSISADGATFIEGTNGTTLGDVEHRINGLNSFFGIYHSTTALYYGVSVQLPAPTGTSTIGGYFTGLGIGGSTASTHSPIFGVLNSTDSGAGIGSTGLTVYDDHTIVTFNNTLDNGSGLLSTLNLYSRNGDTAASFTKPQISFGYANSTQYAHYIHSRHNGGTAVNNALDFYTGDGTAGGVFPTNAIHGLTINDGLVGGAGITTPSAGFHCPASTTAAASLRVPSGTAPTSPNDGDMWYDGTNVKFRVGGTTKTFTLA